MAADRSIELGRHSNLQSFLDSTTPSVQSHSIPKAYARDLERQWQPASKDKVEFFYLRNLWKQYYEWSAYGTGVPIWLPDRKPVVQYYTLYLSAIQIYTTKVLTSSRLLEEENGSSSWSDESKSDKNSRSLDGVSEGPSINYDGSWPTIEQIGHICLQFSAGSNSYQRIPFLDKVIRPIDGFGRKLLFRTYTTGGRA